MSKTYDQLSTQDAFGYRLRNALHGLQRKLGAAPNVAGQLTRCRELFDSRRAWEDQDLLPSPIPTRSRCDSDKLVAIVLHETKLAIIRWWELIRTGQTTGLDDLIGNLEGYAEHGLGECVVLGGPEDGYYIFNRAGGTSVSHEDIPEPPVFHGKTIKYVPDLTVSEGDVNDEDEPGQKEFKLDVTSLLPNDEPTTESIGEALAQEFLDDNSEYG